MCGIFGFNWEDKSLLLSGLKEIAHRGPDGSGTLIKKGVSLGHVRLAIIDISSAGRQPMSNEDGSVWITFNGEIYNYKELRQNLKQKHNFMSDSDTEVMLHLYEEEGPEFVKKLQGMFAFCIYDLKRNSLIIGRDRIGKKPLYYYSNGKKLIFASEIKSILKEKSVKVSLNPGALPAYLAFRANTTENTFFDKIKKLMPGSLLKYDLANNKIKLEKYWEINLSPGNLTEESYIKKVKDLLEDSVKSRLISDVPLGAYLSGGIDSGAVVAIMSKFSRPVKTFSVGFEQGKGSELESARETSKLFKTSHHELLLSKDSIKRLPEIIYNCDEPLADPTVIPTYFLSEYAKKYCTVVLTGEGADELFGGYPQYKFMLLHKIILDKMPKSAKGISAEFFRHLPPSFLNLFFSYAKALGEKGIERFYKYALANNPAEAYLQQVAIFNEEEQKELLMNNASLYAKYSSYYENGTFKNIVGRCGIMDLKGPMVEDLLMKLDKNTMAFGIEARAPFLDYRLVELAFQIPDKYKISFSQNKIVLRKAIRDILTKDKSLVKKKHFFVPIDNWLDVYLGVIKKDLLSEEFIKKQGIFNYEYIQKINRDYEKSKLFYARQLWTLLTFQIWYKKYFENHEVKL